MNRLYHQLRSAITGTIAGRVRFPVAAALVLGLGLLAVGIFRHKPVRTVSGPLSHEVYVWQRAWTPDVLGAVSERAVLFKRVVCLAAEVQLDHKPPHVARAAIPYAELRALRVPVGLAIRVGTYSGPFDEKASATRLLLDLAKQVLTQAQSNRLELSEVQIDFDCAESRLAGYAQWIRLLSRHAAPIPVTWTALPSWLDRRAFGRLACAGAGYVLQVHSFERARYDDPSPTLCSPEAARRAVLRAARWGAPFRVALPTYGYVVGFDRAGRLVGLSAEGPSPRWPSDTQLREVHADPVQMAELVRHWQTARPETMTGLIWYRLPMPGDRLNWRWPTLHAVMQGRTPEAGLRLEMDQPEPGLAEFELVNAGDGPHRGSVRVRVQCSGGRLLAWDAFGGFVPAETSAQALEFHSGSNTVELAPGDRRRIGWVRFTQESKLVSELEP